MPNNAYPRDRFDDVPREQNRVGAHRAENPSMRTGLVLLWAAVAAIVLFLAGVFGSLVLTDRITFGSGAAAPSPTAASVQPTIDASYSVLVLNATPDEGNLEKARALVVAGGWAEGSVSATQADSTDFAETTVMYNVDADKAAAEGLAQVVGATRVVKADGSASSTSAERELTLIVGADFGS